MVYKNIKGDFTMSVYVNVRDVENGNYIEDINIDDMTVNDLNQLLDENGISDPEFHNVTFDGISEDLDDYEDFYIDDLISLKNRYVNLDASKDFLQDIWNDSSSINETLDRAETVDMLNYQEIDILEKAINELSKDFDEAFRIVNNHNYEIFEDYDALGRYYADMNGDIPEWLEYYIDYESLGKDYFQDEENGIDGEYGFYIVY